MASDTSSEESAQSEEWLLKFERRLEGLARLSITLALLCCLIVFLIGCLGLVISVFSRRVRLLWKRWLLMAAGGATGFVGMLSWALGQLPTFLRRK